MPRALLLFAAMLACAADDPWDKVRKLKSGAEIRVVKRGAAQPVLGRFDEARDDVLLLVVGKTQTSIPRDAIDRLDARPAASGKTKVESKSSTSDPDYSRPPQGPPAAGARQSVNSGSSISFSKPEFETVYRRPPK